MKTSRKKRRKNRGNKRLITVSALALSASPFGTAGAMLQAQCVPNIRFGSLVACANGKITIQPTGAFTTSGCVVTLSAPAAAVCTVWNAPPTATRSVKVSFTTHKILAIAGANSVTVKNFILREQGQPTTAKTLTFSAAAINAKVTIDVGATVIFSASQPAGAYSGSVRLNANFL